MDKSKIAKSILHHPDFQEILAKLIAGISISDIAEWLDAKYTDPNEKNFALSVKTISTFQKDYLDFYNIVRDDINKTKNNLSVQEELKSEIAGTPTYHKALEKYVNSEVDINIIVRRLVANIELRASQVFDFIQSDPENTRMDKTLIEWFNTLTAILEKYDTILNGNPDKINIQNNINIQVLDSHINVIYNIIKEILSKLDYDTSLLFMELFNSEMQKLKSSDDKMLSLEDRVAQANILSTNVMTKMENR